MPEEKGAHALERGFPLAAVTSWKLLQGLLVEGFLLLSSSSMFSWTGLQKIPPWGETFREGRVWGSLSVCDGRGTLGNPSLLEDLEAHLSSVFHPRAIKEYFSPETCIYGGLQASPQFLGLTFLPWHMGSHEVAPKHSSKGSVSSKLWNPTCPRFLCPGTQQILLCFPHSWTLWVSASLSAPNSHGFVRIWASLGNPEEALENSRVWGAHSHWLTWEYCARLLVLPAAEGQELKEHAVSRSSSLPSLWG